MRALATIVFAAVLCASATAKQPEAAAVFVAGDLARAKTLAELRLARDPANPDALFIRMETAALELDEPAALQMAVRLCETRRHDLREIAAARIVEAAANTAHFRAVVPRLRKVLARGTPQAAQLRLALLAAALDGAPGLDAGALARQAGLITRWRVAGPFGRFSNVDFDRHFPPEQDRMSRSQYGQLAVEDLESPDGALRLPEYFARQGVYYAAGDVHLERGGEWTLEAESAATLHVFLDGVPALLKDNRFRTGPDIRSTRLRLAAGKHRIVVKFVPVAAPFRISVRPPRPRAVATAAGPLREYLLAASSRWKGDLGSARRRAESLLKAAPYSAAAHTLLAQIAGTDGNGSAEEIAHLRAAVAGSSSAWSATLALARDAWNDDRTDEALELLRRVLAAQPESHAAQALIMEIAARAGWQAEALAAAETLVRLYPSCRNLSQAADVFSSAADLVRASEVERRLEGCAPGSLHYVEALSDAGRHAEAARAAAGIVRERPLDRNARAAWIEELRLGGETAASGEQASALAALAPNWTRYQRTRDALEPEPPLRSPGFAGATAFYSPLRRSAFDVLRDTAERRFSGGPAVTLLLDKVVHVTPEGGLALYVHKLTRLLDRDGIERYGEVSIPQGAELLELRTIKSDGTVAEPEFMQHKPTVSMPALAPGDAVDMEYVVRYPANALEQNPEAFRMVFGSFTAPIVLARYALVAAPGAAVEIRASPGAPPAMERRIGHDVVRTWEQNDIPQSAEETAMPSRDVFPVVALASTSWRDWGHVRDSQLERVLEAAVVTPRVEAAAREAKGAAEQKARQLAAYVLKRIHRTAWGAGDLASADDSLARGEGSRTAALLALARAAGLQADLVLAREIGKLPDAAPSGNEFSHPLVRFVFPAGELVVDVEAGDNVVGELAPALDRDTALLVTLPPDEPGFIRLPRPSDVEHSVAEGDVAIDTNGDLSATLHIHLGSWRGAQMRSVLRGIAPAERQHFFEQLAMRIFPGAVEVAGEVENESAAGEPLRLKLSCRAPRFLGFHGDSADLDQLVPALGLRRMYVGAVPRRFPLYIDLPLFETATFRVRLAPGLRVTQRPAGLALTTDFGDYKLSVRESGDAVEVRRSFRIPVQVVPPERWEAFAGFAAQIDEVERQRLGIERSRTLGQVRSFPWGPHLYWGEEAACRSARKP